MTEKNTRDQDKNKDKAGAVEASVEEASTAPEPPEQEPREPEPPEQESPEPEPHEPEPTEPEPVTQAPANQPTPPRRSRAGVVALVAVLLVAALTGAGGWYLHQQVQSLVDTRSQYAEQSALDALAARQSERVGEVGGRLDALSDTLEGRLQAIARLENRLADQVEARGSLADRVDQLYRRMESETDDWREAEAAYLAGIAVNRVRFNGDIGGALEALEAADRLLAGLGGAGVDAREAIAAATNRLLDAERGDRAAIMTGLGRVADQLDDLPLAEGIARRSADDAEAPASTPPAGWQARLERAWQQLRSGLEGLVTVSRNRQVEPLPDPEARFLLQQNLLLQLESARLAALGGDAEGYRAAVARVDGWVAAYFDSASGAVVDVRERLAELGDLRIQADRPAIADDLEPLLGAGGQP